jgi:precorrin-8X/cobalt-precorrin-8 methylmutase
MATIVVVGSSQTRILAGRMVTPRGYPPPSLPEPANRRARPVHPIEAESYRILRSRLDLQQLGPLSRAVVERIVHASGDLSYADDLVLDEAALQAGLAALRAGAPIVVDAGMVAAAITTRPTICALDLADREPASPEAGRGTSAGAAERPRAPSDPGTGRIPAGEDTRSAAGVRAAARAVGPGAIWVVGCAPTALAALLEAHADPVLVIGLPVGFVGAVEAKRALAVSGLPAVTNRSVKGGSAVAAAALNALLYLEGAP